jgi:proline dehydrogenase
VSLPGYLLRRSILRISEAGWFRHLATRTPPGRAFATRFVAGETLAEAMAVARQVHERGMSSMFNQLGENVETPQQALEAREAYLSELAAIAANPELDGAISVKLTQLGLDESTEACWSNLAPILAEAERDGTLVMMDMESHAYVDRTLEITARAHATYARTGVAVQAYLRRSERDVFSLPAGCRVRLVKGAYLEPDEVVIGGKRAVDEAYARLFATLFARGHPIDVATHDPSMIEGVKRHVELAGEGWSRVEIQMLYGVRRDLQAQLAGQGYPVRVYIPYGTDWYPYLTRRLAERPANLWFFLSNVLRRG